MAVSRHSFQPTPPSDRAIPKAITCLEEIITSVAAGEESVFILGERGTRKEAVARGVHALSARAREPFVPVSRPELTEEFIERALFGGGAPGNEPGRLEAAAGGTLFLDEVCDFPLATQARLARVLDSQRVRPEDSGHPGVRLLAASVHEPEVALKNRTLHPELYDHLRVFIVRVPPLRDRKGDILVLAHEALATHTRMRGRPAPPLSSTAISCLIAYPWPGNAHELEQCMAHALVMAEGKEIDECHLPAAVRGEVPGDAAAKAGADTLQTTIESVERALIEEALRASHGNQAKAAQSLGITERLMGLRVKKYGIESRHFRQGGAE